MANTLLEAAKLALDALERDGLLIDVQESLRSALDAAEIEPGGSQMVTAMDHPFGGEAAVLYLSVLDQIGRQQPHLTVADVYAVLNLLSAEAEVQLSMDMARRVAGHNVEFSGDRSESAATTG